MILVFGAAGFIGTYLSDQPLRDGYEVIVSDRSETAEAYNRKQANPYPRVDITEKAEIERQPVCGIQEVAAAIAGPAGVSAMIHEGLVDSSGWGQQ